MNLLKIAQTFNSTSKEQRSELLKTVDVNYCIPDTVLGKQNVRKKWAGYTSLHIAVMKNDIDLANELLDRGADLLKQATIDGRTPLHVVLGNECVYGVPKLQRHSLINTLLTRQVEIKNIFNPKCKDGISHFHIACVVNHINAVEFFAKAKEPLHQPINCDSYLLRGYTPLHCAIKYSSVEVVDILLQHGANICFENPMGLSSLHLLVACILNISDLMKMGMRTLCMSYERETVRLESIVKLVLKTRANNGIFMDDTGLSALHIACTLRDKSIAEDFLKKGVNVNFPVKSESKRWPGWTPLHFAACSNIPMMILLMKNGANILIKNCKGETALDLCTKRYTPADIQLILSMRKEFRGIVLSDNSTKLSDLLVSMNTCVEFHNFLEELKDVNTVIPLNSPIWPGYSLLHLAVSLNDRTKFRTYLDDDSESAESADFIPERYNCTEDEESLYVERIDLLLEYGCSVSMKNAKRQTAIHLAFDVRRKATVKQLLSHSKVNVVDQNGLSHLHIACAMGNLFIVKRYLGRGADVNGRVRVGFDWYSNKSLENVRANSTPLHVAVAYGYLDVVEYLLANNADVYAQDSLGFTPIHLSMSSKFNSNDMAILLLRATPNLRDSVTSGGLSHLHVAAWATEDNSLQKLLLNGAQVDRVVEANVCSFLDPWVGKTPLLVAVNKSCDKVVNTLLKAGANVYAKDAKGISAMKHALHNMSDGSAIPFVQMVKAGECEVESCGMTSLHVACGYFDIEWTRRLLENGADVNARISDDDDEWNGATPLYMLIHMAMMYFADESLVDLVKLLVDEGADVTLECNGVTTLHMIYDYSYNKASGIQSEFFPRSLDLLLKSHKSHDVNPSNHKGFTHFHCACLRNDVETVTKLLNDGADVNEPIDPLDNRDDEDEEEISGFTPLHFAMGNHCREVAYLLLDRGADVNAEDARGNRPLHVALRSDFVDLPLMETMNNLRADIHATNLNDETPLYCFLESESGHLTLQRLEFFLKYGCLISILNTTDEFHQGIIGLAMRSTAPTELQLILKRLIQLDEMRKAIQSGFNAIRSIVAIDRNDGLTLDDYLNAIQLFINNGCDIDQQDTEGKTALHAAVSFCNLNTTGALLQLGADINVIDNQNTCPFSDKIVGRADGYYYSEYEKLVMGKALACHVWKMRLAGLELTESNLRYLGKVEEQFSLINLLEQSCQDELTKATETTVCEGLTVKDFLSELGAVAQYPRMCLIQRNIIDKYFKCTADLRREFPKFCGILAYQYRKALARMKLWRPAMEAIIIICDVELPDLCAEALLRYFTNSEMQRLVEVAEELIK